MIHPPISTFFRLASLCGALCACSASAQSYKYDFGDTAAVPSETETGYTGVGVTAYTSGLGYGWVSTTGLSLRDRAVPHQLYRDFIFTNTTSSAVFRVSGMPAGKYLMKVTCGDASYGDHTTTISVPGMATQTLAAKTAQYLTLVASVQSTGTLNITFGSPTPNWVVNAISLEPTTDDTAPYIVSDYVSEWNASVFATDPTADLLAKFNPAATTITPTGRARADYLTLIAGEIDFWKTKQNSSGAIIDPYRNAETQYATPAFANAAGALVAYAGRTDLIEPAAKAMDWASSRLKTGAAADGHDDFYPGMLANALRLLKPFVTTTRSATWESNLNFDPYAIYNYAPGSFNWNVVSSSGEALLQLAGIRSSTNPYAAVSWGSQGRHFTTPYGLYTEGPMPYDHFPRIWFEDAIAQGYNGPYTSEVTLAMDRAAITSLFMQSPWGELPAGGRSAHHQWNEAEQCVTYEIYAAKAETAGNTTMAAAYKRAAHLSLSSMFRWIRPTGEMQIVKNWVDPASRHGYESYSYHSQYNLLPSAMLAIAYEHAGSSEDIAEGPAPADAGGYVFQISDPDIHKVFANAGGTYVELDTNGDHHYDATGLIRIHKKGITPQLGPSDSLLASSSYTSPNPSSITTGVGVSWQNASGTWVTLGQMDSTTATSVVVTPLVQTPSRVAFDVVYSGALPNVTSITEHYVVTPDGVQLTTQVAGYSGPLRYVWPVLSNDGKTTSSISVSGKTVSVSQGGGTPQTFTVPAATSVSVGATDYSNHNGWARLATAEFANSSSITLLISQTSPTTAYWKGDVNGAWNTNTAGNTNWSILDTGSSDTGTVPGSATDVVFAANGAANLGATTLGSDLSIRSLNLQTTSPVGIGGSNNLTFGAGGLNMDAAAGAVTLNTTGQVVLGANQTWTNNSINTLTVSSVVSGGVSLAKEGSGPLIFGAANTFSGGLNVNGGAVTASGAGTAGTGPINLSAGTSLNLSGAGVYSLPNTVTGSGSVTTQKSTSVTGDFSGFTGTFTHNSTTTSVSFNTASATSANAAYGIASSQGSSQGMIAAGNGDYTLSIGSLGGVANSLFRGGNSATGTTILQIGGLNTDSVFQGTISDGATKKLGLIKVGTGKLTLAGANTYTADTTVSAGTLAVDGDSLADSIKLIIDGGKVETSGTETVDALYFGAVLQAAGTWGATGSGAAHIDDTRFTGTGVVNAVTGAAPAPYDTWSASNGLTGSNNGPAQDPDSDGIANVLEFVLGGDPLSLDTGTLPAVLVNAGSLIFTFIRNDASEAEISLTFQYGSDLTGWANVAIGAESAGLVTVTENSTSPDTIVVTIPETNAVAGKLYGRLMAVK